MLKPTICLLFPLLLKLASTAQIISNTPILTHKQVPILCYHQIRNWKAKDRQIDKDYIIPPVTFKAQMKMLSDSGYHTILPDELYDYLITGKTLPSKPVMITFDDTNEDQYAVARPELAKYHFKAVYFIVTGHIDTHKWYMDHQQIKQLSDEGNMIGCHTLSHGNFKNLKGVAWETEVSLPKKQLEEITGKKVDYFAFPYGYWNTNGLPELYKRGFKAAFQLDQPRDLKYPIMTIRRIVACGYWNPETLDHHIKHDFGHPLKQL